MKLEIINRDSSVKGMLICLSDPYPGCMSRMYTREMWEMAMKRGIPDVSMPR
jgi:hypothetical protein